MKIQILKAGNFAFDPAGLKIVTFEEGNIGQVINNVLSNDHLYKLVAAGWVKIVEEISADVTDGSDDESSEDDEDDEDNVITGGKSPPGNDDDEESWDEDEDEDENNDDSQDDSQDDGLITTEKLESLVMNAKTEAEAKQILQDWGSVNLDQKISKTYTVPNMIAKLIELTMNQV